MKSNYEPKPLFVERMKKLLGKEFETYMKSLESEPLTSIRCNTLKITPYDLKKRLENKGWIIVQPFKNQPEIMIIKNELQPGELGRSLEHVLGYYYVQDIASMLPILALNPKPYEFVLDLAASPGSKTTQAAAFMNNQGTIIANDVSLGRIKILASNTERCGASNVIIVKKEGSSLCLKLKNLNYQFDKILIDAPCSGEGTFISAPRGFKMWNINTIKKLSKVQKYLIENAWKILKPNGELVYSTCTHAPEENEEIVDFMLKKFNNIKIETINLPIKCRKGLTKWGDKKYNSEVTKSCRIYPQDNNTEGFFIAKFRKIQ